VNQQVIEQPHEEQQMTHFQFDCFTSKTTTFLSLLDAGTL